MQKRNYKWDNLKFILIFFVVFGHILSPFTKASKYFKGLYLYIYLFHMPLFIFLSGMFSQNTVKKRKWKRIISYLLLYFFIRTLDGIGAYIKDGTISFNYTVTNGPDWYALVIFFCLLITIYLQKMSKTALLITAAVLGVFAGYIPAFGSTLASMRFFVFYPFFLMGYCMNREWLEKKANYITAGERVFVLFLLLILGSIVIWKGSLFWQYINLFRAKLPYQDLGLYGLKGPFLRCIHYIIAVFLGSLIIFVVPDQKYRITRYGTDTLSVYAFHYFFLDILWRFGMKEKVLSLFPNTCLFILLG